MQFLGPLEKDMKAHGCLFCTFSGKKRSGSNFSGSGQYSGFLLMYTALKKTFDPNGRTVSPAKYIKMFIDNNSIFNSSN